MRGQTDGTAPGNARGIRGSRHRGGGAGPRPGSEGPHQDRRAQLHHRPPRRERHRDQRGHPALLGRRDGRPGGRPAGAAAPGRRRGQAGRRTDEGPEAGGERQGPHDPGPRVERGGRGHPRLRRRAQGPADHHPGHRQQPDRREGQPDDLPQRHEQLPAGGGGRLVRGRQARPQADRGGRPRLRRRPRADRRLHQDVHGERRPVGREDPHAPGRHGRRALHHAGAGQGRRAGRAWWASSGARARRSG